MGATFLVYSREGYHFLKEKYKTFTSSMKNGIQKGQVEPRILNFIEHPTFVHLDRCFPYGSWSSEQCAEQI